MSTAVPEPQPLLRIEDLRVDIGAVSAVRGISFNVGAGEIVGIVGESGSGKSITCRAVLGLLPPNSTTAGRIAFDDRNLATLPEAELRGVRGTQLSMIFQNPASHLVPLMTVGRHVAEPLRLHFGYSARRGREAAIRMLRDVQIRAPERRVDAYPHELSGGMKQRAMIGSAIACSPRLLLADEPTTALDVTVQARILELLRDLNRRLGLSVVLVSHDLGVVAEICDRVVVMQDGLIVEQGSTREIIGAPRHAYTRLLIESQPGRLNGERDQVPSSGDGAGASPLVEVRGVSVQFGSRAHPLHRLLRREPADAVCAVDDASFSVRAGESLGIVGESGSGKSTIAQTITRLVQPSAGDILFRGKSVLDLRGAELSRFRRAVQMVFQNPFDSLNPRMTAEQAVAEPIVQHGLADGGRARERAHELLTLVELPLELAQRRPRQLSGGQCQRVGFARALALEPEVLIADEITSALDVTIQAQILALLRRLRRTQKLTVIYISHDLSVVRAFCDRVAVFQAGRLVEIGAVADVLTRPREDYTRALLASAPRLAAVSRTERLQGVSEQ